MNKKLARILYGCSLSSLLMLSAPVFADQTSIEHARFLGESRKTAQEFMQTLGGTLKKQLAEAGAESAIGVCKQVAPALANEYSKNGRVVKRVSLNTRNVMQGTPDEWEKSMLENFEHQQQQGLPVSDMEVSQEINGPDGRWYRYMKAIPTQPLCLQCHGKPSDITEDVRKLLLKEYPQDKAVGYAVGQIRGAVSIKYPFDADASVTQ